MYESNYLAHHGILGMKWGVRRYQNEDGTLTEAGKKRYARDMANMAERERKAAIYASKQKAKADKLNAKALKIEAKTNKLEAKADRKEAKERLKMLKASGKEQGRKLDDAEKQKILDDGDLSKAFKNSSSFTDKELQAVIDKYTKTTKLNRLVAGEIDENGKTKAERLAAKTKTVNDLLSSTYSIVDSGVKMYNLYAATQNSLNGGKMKKIETGQQNNDKDKKNN